jgi:hypothetical protein
VAAVAALLLIPATAAGATSLSNPQVSPRSVVQGDVVTFSVVTTGKANVTVQVELAHSGAATIVRDLSVVSRTGNATTWRFQSSAIPAGSWSVTFAVAGTTTTLPAGTLTVSPPPTPAPTPTTKPTPTPTPTPRPATTPSPPSTPRPTPANTSTPDTSPPAGSSAGAIVSPGSSGGSATAGSTSPGVAAQAGARSPSPSGATAGSGATTGSGGEDRTGQLLLSVLLGLFVIGGVAGIAILTARRRAEDEPAPAAAPSATTFVAARGTPDTTAFRQRATMAPPPPAERKRAGWEVYSALEDEPIGTVDDLAPDAPSHGPAEPGRPAPGEDG